jgi:hypothetical protein
MFTEGRRTLLNDGRVGAETRGIDRAPEAMRGAAPARLNDGDRFTGRAPPRPRWAKADSP